MFEGAIFEGTTADEGLSALEGAEDVVHFLGIGAVGGFDLFARGVGFPEMGVAAIGVQGLGGHRRGS